MTKVSTTPPTGWRRIQNRRDFREFLVADMQAHNVKRWRFYLSPRYPELKFQRLLRYVEYLDSRKGPHWRVLYVIHRVRLARRAVLTGISIPPGVFGPGLSIAHTGSIVVNDGARVGSWCRIHSSTNIGVYDGGAPTIGSRAYIAPGAVIFGGCVLGDGVAIGANSVVNADFGNGVTIAGSPAKLVSDRDSDRVLPPWFPSSEMTTS